MALLDRLRRESPEAAAALDELLSGLRVEGPRSLREEATVTCPHCHGSYSTELWVVVDAQEQPELAAKVRDGTIIDVTCRNCQKPFTPDAPLLYHDAGEEQLILAAPLRTSQEEDRATNRRLAEHLLPRIGGMMTSGYLGQTQVVPGVKTLSMILQGHDPRALVRALAGGETSEGSETTGQNALLDAVRQFVSAETWGESRRIVEETPELLTPDAALVLDQMAALATSVDPDVGRTFTEHRELLDACRRLGIRQAFRERDLAHAGDPADPASSIRRGNVLEDGGDLDGAQEAYLDALRVAEQNNSGEDKAIALNNLADIARKRDRGELAFSLYQRAISEADAGGHEGTAALARASLATVYIRRGDLDAGEELLEKARPVLEKIGDPGELSALYNTIAILHENRGDYLKAEKTYLDAMELLRDYDDYQLGALYINLGGLYARQKQSRRAMEMFEKGLAIHERSGDERDLIGTYNNIGTTHIEQRDDARALEAYHKAVEIAVRLNARSELASVYGNLGGVYAQRNDHDRALHYFQQSIAIAEEIGEAMTAANTHFNLGKLLAGRGRTSEAVRHVSIAKEQFVKMGRKQEEGTAALLLLLLEAKARGEGSPR